MASDCNKKISIQFLPYIVTALLFLLVTHDSKAQGFFEDVELNLRGGVHNFHGNFIPYDAYSDVYGLPFPFLGYNAAFGFSKPIELTVPDFSIRINVGLEYVRLETDAATRNTVVGPLQPMNIKNHGFGPYLNIGFHYFLTQNFTIEPSIGVSLLYNNPTTDGFFDSGRTIYTPDRLATFTGNRLSGSPPYALRDIEGTDAWESISAFVPAASAAIRFSRNFLGNYWWFLEYRHMIMLDNTFDGIDQLDSNPGQRDEIDGMSMVTTGVSFPLDRRLRRTEQTQERRERLDRRELIRVERVENIAALITTEDDLRELQRAMSDKILLYDTPGVRFNELASRVVERRVRLADSEIMTQMVELPGSSYIIGLNSVDELNIQIQSRKRITINPFMIDKYAVTNRQYRAFLIAMGALPRTASQVQGGDPANFNFGSPLEWDELLRRAELSDYRQHIDPPRLDDPMDLLPDSTQWVRFGLNDVVPWDIYFYDPFYDNYPVVNVNWYQARLFTAWADKRMVTESEWEYAARSGVSGRIFPWDGLDVQTKTGEYRANFMQERGVYDKDGYAIMAPVDAFLPNDFGLYNMAGNVSEWVLDSYNPSYSVLQNVGTANFVSPSYVNINEPRKVHRGGSWQSTEFFLGVGVRNFQHKNLGTPMVGFRAARSITRRYGQ